MRLAAILLAIGLGVAPAGADVPTTTVPPRAPVAVIGVTDAPARVEEVRGRLEQIEAEAQPTAAVGEIAVRVPALARSIDEHAERDRGLLGGRIDLAGLDALDVRWSDDAALITDWDQKVRRRAEELDALVAELKDLGALWRRTLESLGVAEAPSDLLDRIRATLAAIEETRGDVAGRRDEILTLRNQLARQRAVVTEARALVGERRKELLGRLWTRDQPPIWEVFRAREAPGVAGRVRAVLAGDAADLAAFLRGERPGRWSIVLLMLGVTAGTLALALRARRWRAQGVDLDRASLLVERPISAAVALWGFAVGWTPAPLVARRLATLVLVVPVVRLLVPLLGAAAPPVIGFVVVSLILDRLQDVFVTVPEVGRPLFLVQMAVGIAAVRWIRAHWTVATTPVAVESAAAAPGRRRSWLDHLATLAGGLLAFAAGGDVLGFTQLASLVGNGVLASARSALALWVLARVLDGIVVIALRVPPLRGSRLVRRNPARVTRRTRRLIRGTLAVLWAIVVLEFFRAWSVVVEWAGRMLAGRLEVGTVQISLGDVLVFGAGVAVAVVLARVVHVVLEEEVLSRVHLPRGVPYAISTFAGYGVLLLGLVTAFGAAGADLSRVSLVLGALGVGIGFGLQEIVKDFVAGAVLLFERPIQLGDVVQMGELSGDVRRIGLRSSTVHTFQGAEVIVPNSMLTSSQIVNWTLSDRARRIDFALGVAYGTDPHRVIALLEEVARRHPDVLEDPPPRAVFMGFGDSALDFEVRAWTTRVDQTALMRSELGLAVHAALAEAAIEVPFPQRDVRLRRDGAAPGTPKA